MHASFLLVLLLSSCAWIRAEDEAVDCSTQYLAADLVEQLDEQENDEQVAMQVAMKASFVTDRTASPQEARKQSWKTVALLQKSPVLPNNLEEDGKTVPLLQKSPVLPKSPQEVIIVPSTPLPSGVAHFGEAPHALPKIPPEFFIVPSTPLPSGVAHFGQALVVVTTGGLLFLVALVSCGRRSWLPVPTPMPPGDVAAFRASWSMWLLGMSHGALMMTTTDQYLPSMAQMQVDFGTTSQVISLTLQVNWFTKAVAALIMAGLADRLGRKPVLAFCSLLAALGSLTCACAPSAGWFFAGRVFQGIAEGSEPVMLMIGRDMFEDINERMAWMSSMMAILLVAPLLAPVFGGMIGYWIGWRVPFLLLCFWGLTNTCFIKVLLQETITATGDRPSFFSEVKRVATDGHLMVLALVQALAMVLIFSVDTSLSLILAQVFYRNQMQISLMLGSLVLWSMAGAIFSEGLSSSVGVTNTLRGIMAFSALPVISIILVGIFATQTWQPILVSLGPLLFCSIVAFISSNALYFQPVKDVSGAAAGINSFTSMMFTSVATFVSKIFVHGSGNQVRGLANWAAGVMIVTLLIFWPFFGFAPPKWVWGDADKSPAEDDDKGASIKSTSAVGG